MVDVEQLERVEGVLSGWAGVHACGFEVCVAEELGDGHEVGAALGQAGREGVVAARVRRVVEARCLGDGGDDVVGAADGEPFAALVDKQGGGLGCGPVRASWSQSLSARRSWLWIGISRTASALP